MAVEITGGPGAPSNMKTEQAGASTVEPKAVSQNANSNTSVSSADSFTVSPKAESLRVIESSVYTQPDVDGNRVESLKTAIDAGSYDINPLRVAEKLIELEVQFVA